MLFMNIRLLAKLDKWEWEQLVSGIELDICMSNICKLGAEVNAECCLVSHTFPNHICKKLFSQKIKFPQFYIHINQKVFNSFPILGKSMFTNNELRHQYRRAGAAVCDGHRSSCAVNT